MGMSRFTHDEYMANRIKEMKAEASFKFVPNYDGYYAAEDYQVSCAMKDLQRFFNMYKEEFYA